MIKHIVGWKLIDQVNGCSKAENAKKIKELLEALNGKIPGLLHLEVGIDFSSSDNSFDVALYSKLESKEALEVYRTHPDHVAAAGFVKSVCCDRAVIDYEI